MGAHFLYYQCCVLISNNILWSVVSNATLKSVRTTGDESTVRGHKNIKEKKKLEGPSLTKIKFLSLLKYDF